MTEETTSKPRYRGRFIPTVNSFGYKYLLESRGKEIFPDKPFYYGIIEGKDHNYLAFYTKLS